MLHHIGGPTTRQTWKLACHVLAKCIEITTIIIIIIIIKTGRQFYGEKNAEAPPKQCTQTAEIG